MGEARAPSHPSSHHYKLGQLSSAQFSTERYHSRRLNNLASQGDGLQCLEGDETPGQDSKNNDLQSFVYGTSLLIIRTEIVQQKGQKSQCRQQLRPWICRQSTCRVTSSAHAICYHTWQCQYRGFLLLQQSSNCSFTEGTLNGLEIQRILLYCWQCRALFLVLNNWKRKEKKEKMVYLQLSPVVICFIFLVLSPYLLLP